MKAYKVTYLGGKESLMLAENMGKIIDYLRDQNTCNTITSIIEVPSVDVAVIEVSGTK